MAEAQVGQDSAAPCFPLAPRYARADAVRSGLTTFLSLLHKRPTPDSKFDGSTILDSMVGGSCIGSAMLRNGVIGDAASVAAAYRATAR
jgi:hypothetical protein